MSSVIENNKHYFILNAKTLTNLNVKDAGGSGAAVVGATTNWANRQTNSIWQALSAGGNNKWSFRCPLTKTYMTFVSGTLYTPLTAEDYLPDSKNQIWTVAPVGGFAYAPTFFNFQNSGTGKWVDLEGGSSNNGTRVLANEKAGSQDTNQLWVFIPTSAT